MAAVDHAGPRAYGNWRRPGGGGLFGLSKAATYGGLGWAAFSMFVMIFAGPIVGFALLVAGLVALAAGSVPVLGTGRTALQHVAPRAAHAFAVATGAVRYRSGLFGRQPDARFRLPGLAEASTLTEAVDVEGRAFAVVTIPRGRQRHYTVAFDTSPDGAALVDQEDVDTWLDNWAAWLGALGDEPGVVAASVVVETAPDSGERLRREIRTHTHPDAPEVPAAMLREIGETYPAGSATVRAIVTVTFGGRAGRHDEAISDVAGRVAHLGAGLQGTGAGAARPLTGQQWCEAIRTAYDPASAAIFDDARAQGTVAQLDWQDVGPVAADAGYASYQHDSGTSVTWEMTQAPRGQITERALTRLLQPHPEIARKRVALVYRPLDSARAAAVVEGDHRDAEATVRNAERPSARMLAERESAARMAADEAAGAGVLNVALLITATVLDPDRLAVARRVVEQLAPTARIRIRPVHGAQESAFAAALPLGVILPAHKRIRRPS